MRDTEKKLEEAERKIEQLEKELKFERSKFAFFDLRHERLLELIRQSDTKLSQQNK